MNTIYICNLNAYNDSELMRNLSKLMESTRLSTMAGIRHAMHILISIIKFIKRGVKKRTYLSTTGRYPGSYGKSWKRKK